MAGLRDLVNEGDKLKAPSLDSPISGGSNKELMEDARNVLSGNWGLAVAGYLLYMLLILSFMFFLAAAVFFYGASSAVGAEKFIVWVALRIVLILLGALFLLTGPLTVGFMAFYLGIAQQGHADLERFFVGFRRFWKSLGVYFFSTLLIMLWSLLLVIPGIIAAFRYAMVYFIIADDEKCGPFEAIKRSKDMMKGFKWKFFCLNLRFIGWALLASLTAGIGYLWLVPYMQTSYAKFYEDIK